MIEPLTATPEIDAWCELAMHSDVSAVLDLAKTYEKNYHAQTQRADEANENLLALSKDVHKLGSDLKIQTEKLDLANATIAGLKLALQKYSQITDDLLNHCKIDECEECSKIVCPFNEPLHLHHDGCPACCNVPPTELGYQSALSTPSPEAEKIK